MSENIFETLSAINVNEFTQQKGNLTYLSWAHAWRELLKIYPKASYETHEFEGIPFCQTANGCFVKVSVSIGSVTRTEILPVLDYKKKSIPTPNAFDINTAHKRCLAKAIALHGLGLYIYAGEDLPEQSGDDKENAQLRDDIKLIFAKVGVSVTGDKKEDWKLFCDSYGVNLTKDSTNEELRAAKKKIEDQLDKDAKE